MSRLKHEPELRDALAELETNLETPLVPGELVSWAEAAQASVAKVGPLLERQIQHVHEAEYQDIEREDPGLLTRVEHLKNDDKQLLESLASLRKRVDTLADQAPDLEPNELEAEKELEAICSAGLSFVIAVRKQETALTTWHAEALERDRGDVD